MRFLIFVGRSATSGGWNDFAGNALTIEEAREAVRALWRNHMQGEGKFITWYQIVDLETLTVIDSGEPGDV